MILPFDHNFYMKKALEQAHLALEKGETPVGAIIVIEDRIIGKGHNLTMSLKDATAHAEMQAFTAASNFLNSRYLKKCRLYVTLEPCQMCAAASYWTQINEIIYGASDPIRGFSKLNTTLHPKTKILYGFKEKECSDLLNKFFSSRRILKKK